jgi:hypothetical protein
VRNTGAGAVGAAARTERHVGGQLLDPGFQRRLERKAVRAAVPEELDHLDLAAGGHRHRLRQPHIVLPFDETALLRMGDRCRPGACHQRRCAAHELTTIHSVHSFLILNAAR